MDHYQTLGLLPTATPEQIKSAYRRIAMRSHPDRNPGNEKAAQRFREATEAYEVLDDSQKREAYDRQALNTLIENPFAAAKAAWSGFIDETLSTLTTEGSKP